MKRIMCEICGGTDLLKENGVFVCQSCGCKYSLEEVKKMLAVSGTPIQKENTTAPSYKNAEYSNMLQATRDAMVDGRFDSAYSSSIRLMSMNPDNPEFIAIQALTVLGKEKIALDIPLSTSNGMNSFYSAYNKWDATYSERTETLKYAEKYVNVACQAQSQLIREEVAELESQKYTPSLADNLGAIGDALGMLGGDLYSTVHGMGVERDGRRRNTENRIIEQQIEKSREKERKVLAFKNTHIKRIQELYSAAFLRADEIKVQEPTYIPDNETVEKFLAEIKDSNSMAAIWEKWKEGKLTQFSKEANEMIFKFMKLEQNYGAFPPESLEQRKDEIRNVVFNAMKGET